MKKLKDTVPYIVAISVVLLFLACIEWIAFSAIVRARNNFMDACLRTGRSKEECQYQLQMRGTYR